jgi:hypothetical protein
MTDDMEGMTCGKVGHVLGCPGNAGGDHELRPYDNEERLNVGKWVLREYILAENSGGANWEGAAKALEEEGFESQIIRDPDIDDEMWIFLNRFDQDGKLIDEFMLEFSGWDASIVSLFNMVKSEEVD